MLNAISRVPAPLDGLFVTTAINSVAGHNIWYPIVSNFRKILKLAQLLVWDLLSSASKLIERKPRG